MKTPEEIQDACKQVMAARYTMEETIHMAISTAMQEFTEKTGLSPQSIDIVLREIKTVGSQKHSLYICSDVRADVRLFKA